MIFSKKEPNLNLVLTIEALERISKLGSLMTSNSSFEFSLGMQGYNIEKCKARSIIREINLKKAAIVTTDVNCEFYRSIRKRIVNVRLMIYTMDKFCKFNKITIQSYCTARVNNDMYDDYLIKSCLEYISIILDTNDFSDISLYKVTVPRLMDMNLVSTVHYDGYLKTYVTRESACADKLNMGEECRHTSGIVNVGFKDEIMIEEDNKINTDMIQKVIRKGDIFEAKKEA